MQINAPLNNQGKSKYFLFQKFCIIYIEAQEQKKEKIDGSELNKL